MVVPFEVIFFMYICSFNLAFEKKICLPGTKYYNYLQKTVKSLLILGVARAFERDNFLVFAGHLCDLQACFEKSKICAD